MGSASTPIDVLDFQFKLHCRLKVFENDNHNTFSKPCNLVCVASRYGLLFVGTSQDRFQVIELQSIQNYCVKDGDVKNYKRRYISLPSIPQHLAVNCDSTKLCVVLVKDECTKAIVYDIASLLKQQVSISHEIQLSATPGVTVVDLCWNPTNPSIITVCKDDGSLGLYEFKGPAFEVHELPAATGAMCLCWSPKGKQIVVGTKDGKLTQYKPDLTIAKSISSPSLANISYPISLQWISNFQFIAVYKVDGAEPQFNLFVVDTPKGGAINFANYDDVCYSYGTSRPPQFYMLQQPTWGILLVASSNSTEVGVLGLDKDKWNQWILTDSARAELPLSAAKQDTLPVGLALDTSSTQQLLWGESTLPPAPLLLLLSHHGVLCCFDAVNLKPGIPQICSAPESLPDKSGLSAFTTVDDLIPPSNPAMIVKPIPVSHTTDQPPQQQFSVLGGQKFNIGSTPQATFAPSSIAKPHVMTANQSQFNAKLLAPTQTQHTFSIGGPSLQGVSQPFVTKIEQQIPNPSKSMFGVQSLPMKPEVMPTVTTGLKEPKLEVPRPILNQPTPELKPAVPPAKQQTAIVATPSKEGLTGIDEETEALLANIIADECSRLDIEVKMVLQQGSTIKVDVGSDKEATTIVEGTTTLQDFLNEMNEISNSQVAEVHTLKQNLIQTWAWYEEARSRFATYRDPTLRTLILAQPLDAASERRLEEIRHLIYYLDSELTQANAALDDQWENFQDSCKKRFSIKIPNIEAIYQAMVKQNATLQKQVYILKDISMRIRAKMRNASTPRLLVSLENTAELEEQLKNLHVEPKDLLQVRHERVLKRQKRVTKARSEKLKATFLNGNVSHVTVNKPQMNSILQISGLGLVPFSPIAPKRKMAPQTLDFVQSTPLPQETTAPTKMVPVSKSPVATTLFTDQKKTISGFGGGDVKTSAFVPTNAMKPNTLGSQQKTFSFVAPQITTAQILKPITQASSVFSSSAEVVTKPSMFSSAPPSAISDMSKGSMPSVIPSKPSIFDNVASCKPGVFNVPSGISISIIKTNQESTSAEESPKTPISAKASLFAAPPSGISVNNDSKLPFGVPLTTTASAFSSTAFPNFGTILKNASVASNGSTETPSLVTTSFETSSVPTAIAKSTFFGSGTTSLFGQSTGNLTFAQPTTQPLLTIPTEIASAKATPGTTTAATFNMSSSFFDKTSTSSSSTIFGKTPEISSSSASLVFGAKNTENLEASVGNAFVQSAMPSETSTSSQASTVSTSSIFGQAPVFGQSGTTSIFAKAASAFGQSTTSITPSMDNTSTALPATTSSSIFGQSDTITAFSKTTATTPLFGQIAATVASSVSPTITTSSSAFVQSTATTSLPFSQAATTPSSVFGQTVAITAPTQTTTTASSIFGATVASPFLQAGTVQSSAFEQTAQSQATKSLTFAQSNTTTTASTAQITTPSQTTTTASSILGQVATATQFLQTTAPASASTFGQTVATTSSTIFGQALTAATSTFSQATTTSTSVFGHAITSSSAFGQPSTFAQQTASFGQTGTAQTPFGQTAITPTSSVFGQTTIFGNAATAFGQAVSTSESNLSQPTAPTASVFGQPVATTSIAFGQPASTTTPVFGQPASTAAVFGPPAATTTPIFGQSIGFGSNSIFNNTTTKSSSIFGGSSPFGPTPTSTFGSSPFGGAAPATSGAPFGSSTVFGSPATSTMPFGSTNTFGTAVSNASSGFAANKPTFGGNAFGSSDNPLNFSGLSTGTPTTSSSDGFGSGFNQFRNANQEHSNIFGGGSVFGAPAQTSASSVFGGNSPFNKAASAFGAPPAFGSPSSFIQQPTFGQTAFGSTGGNAFSSSSQPGPFSGGSQSVSQSGFGGASPSFQKPASFGSPPAFGSSSAGFGSAPSFGSPAFGGAPGFGSPSKVFGGGESNFAAANAQQQNSTFANLATQPTVGFGNLAQQSPPQTSQPSFSGGSSFSTWR